VRLAELSKPLHEAIRLLPRHALHPIHTHTNTLRDDHSFAFFMRACENMQSYQLLSSDSCSGSDIGPLECVTTTSQKQDTAEVGLRNQCYESSCLVARQTKERLCIVASGI
jgi:hypothetical protein